jgi:hypothetical protein
LSTTLIFHFWGLVVFDRITHRPPLRFFEIGIASDFQPLQPTSQTSQIIQLLLSNACISARVRESGTLTWGVAVNYASTGADIGND